MKTGSKKRQAEREYEEKDTEREEKRRSLAILFINQPRKGRLYLF